MQVRVLLILLLSMGIGCACTIQPDNNFTIYLVRHAEKQAIEDKDPGLTDAGSYRSGQLANWLRDKGIRRIWSSDYQRTRDTAGPLVSTLGLELNLYDPRDLPELADELLDDRHNALIVGHSNTTPDLTRLLCQCDISDMDESEYDQLFVVSVLRGETKVETLSQSLLFAR
jgi:phosphohistidine phosphatase SixA